MSFLASVANTWLPDASPLQNLAVSFSLIATNRKRSQQTKKSGLARTHFKFLVVNTSSFVLTFL